jgi:hypothetical protein
MTEKWNENYCTCTHENDVLHVCYYCDEWERIYMQNAVVDEDGQVYRDVEEMSLCKALQAIKVVEQNFQKLLESGSLTENAEKTIRESIDSMRVLLVMKRLGVSI